MGPSVAAINSDLPASQCEQDGVFQVVQLYSQLSLLPFLVLFYCSAPYLHFVLSTV
jgi:hypothetical protein